MEVARDHAALAEEVPKNGQNLGPSSHNIGHLHVLDRVSAACDGPLGDDVTVDNILNQLEFEDSFTLAGLFIVDRGPGQVVLDRAPSIPHPNQRKGRFALGEGFIGEVAASCEPRMLPLTTGASDELLVKIGLGHTPPYSASRLFLFAVPIKYGEELVGVLTCYRRHNPLREPEDDLTLLRVVAKMLAPSAAARQTRVGKGELEASTAKILGRSKATRGVLDAIRTVSPSDSTVLILGESGTGKELVADAIHRSSPRSGGPFVKVNCAALPEGTLESELFGHEAGAFTGATQRRIGRFEAANSGTIFLDEIGDLPANTQVALLRTLQERTLQRVGGNKDIEVNVRVIAATHRDLVSAIANGEFRQDLYYRLDVFPIRVPSLRDRRTDIPLLADHFVERYALASRKRVRRISSRAIDMLMAYHWPGNVRELENCVERAVLLCEDQVIHGRHLPPTLQMDPPQNVNKHGTLESTLEAIERDMLDDALKLTKGNMAEAARKLGLTERKMGLRVKRHGLDPRRHRPSR